jgi:16S rRNA (uracil1498-N3)-methyltransferase
MRLHRFYIKENIEVGKEIRIEDSELLNQWGRVFRLKAGDKIVVFNGNGFEYEGQFKILSKKEAVLIIDKENDPCLSASSLRESLPPEVHLFQSIIKKDNFELIVQKCTEIGVSVFHPIISERSDQAHSAWARQEKNIKRLEIIAKEASEQSGKLKLPEIFEPEDLEKAISDFDLSAQAGGEIFVLDFVGEPFSSLTPFVIPAQAGIQEMEHRIREDDRKGDGKIAIFVGPEGGWSDKERELFKQKGIKSISLGDQILRAETSAIAISALILLQ